MQAPPLAQALVGGGPITPAQCWANTLGKLSGSSHPKTQHHCCAHAASTEMLHQCRRCGTACYGELAGGPGLGTSSTVTVQRGRALNACPGIRMLELLEG